MDISNPCVQLSKPIKDLNMPVDIQPSMKCESEEHISKHLYFQDYINCELTEATMLVDSLANSNKKQFTFFMKFALYIGRACWSISISACQPFRTRKKQHKHLRTMNRLSNTKYANTVNMN
jgi:hypothetical protein